MSHMPRLIQQVSTGIFFDFFLIFFWPGEGRKRLRRPRRIDPDRFSCETERSGPVLSQILQNGKIRLRGCALWSQETDALCSQETDALCSQEIDALRSQETYALCSQETYALCAQEIDALCSQETDALCSQEAYAVYLVDLAET